MIIYRITKIFISPLFKSATIGPNEKFRSLFSWKHNQGRVINGVRKKLFADSVYWIALINPADQWFEQSQNIGATLGKFQIVTTVEILTETLNFYAERGKNKRAAVARLIRSI